MSDARSYINGAPVGVNHGGRDEIGTIVPDSSFAVAVGRFRSLGAYRASTLPGAPLRATRAEAEADELAWRERER